MTDLPPKEQKTSTATMPESVGERGTPEEVRAAFDDIILHGFAPGTASAAGIGADTQSVSAQDLHRVADRINPQHMEFAMEPGTAVCQGAGVTEGVAHDNPNLLSSIEQRMTDAGRGMAAAGRDF